MASGNAAIERCLIRPTLGALGFELADNTHQLIRLAVR